MVGPITATSPQGFLDGPITAHWAMADRDEVSIREASRILIFIGYVCSQYDGNQSDSTVRRSLVRALGNAAHESLFLMIRITNSKIARSRLRAAGGSRGAATQWAAADQQIAPGHEGRDAVAASVNAVRQVMQARGRTACARRPP
ncbi:hypothetical protein WT81_05125 [Burkholderia stagnalis]|nr:hypothetical protein WT81_05125 [Burkholderia stagnalis]